MKIKIPALLIIITVGLIVSPTFQLCAASRLNVFVSIMPQKYFVEQIGKERVTVNVMVKPGASPATYEPKPRQMAELSKAKLYFSIGVPFEHTWLKRIASAHPDMKIVQTDEGIQKVAMEVHHHEHDDEHEHDDDDSNHLQNHKALDPHIWLSPTLVKVQARIIFNALQKTDPVYREEYEKNYKGFIAKIEHLNQELKNIFANQNELQFIVFHPSWGYFARDFGLKQIPIEVEGKNPKPAQLKELIKHALKNHIRIVFVQPQFSARSARLVARAIRGNVVYADPLAEHWIKNLKEIARKLIQSPPQ